MNVYIIIKKINSNILSRLLKKTKYSYFYNMRMCENINKIRNDNKLSKSICLQDYNSQMDIKTKNYSVLYISSVSFYIFTIHR